MDYRKFAIKVARQAGGYLLSQFKKGSLAWKLKSSHEVVTTADIASEKIILSLFKKYTPQFQILSEEMGFAKQKSDYMWVVDPLDGTTNFKVHNPIFSVSIALYYKGEPKVSVVYAPFIGDLFVAEKGKGAYLNNRRLHVSTTAKLEKSFLTYCYGPGKGQMERALKIYNYFKMHSVDMRQLGSAAIELAWVAAGRTECIVIPGTKPWDAAVGVLLVTEAGGKVTDFKGRPWGFINKKTGKISLNVDMLATNGRIHNLILRRV